MYSLNCFVVKALVTLICKSRCTNKAYLLTYLQFGDYFGEDTLANQWVRNPFSFPVTPRDGLTLQEEEALVELNSNMDLKH